MKKIAMLISAAALMVCGSLNAQVVVDTVNVKFASPVTIGGKTLPAGECTFHIARSATNVMLSARSENGESSSILVNRSYDDAPSTGNADIILERRNDGLHFERLILPDHSAFSALPNAD